MTQETMPDDGWYDCEPGILVSLSKKHRNRRSVVRAASIAFCMTVIGIAAIYFVPSESQTALPVLECEFVGPMLVEYMDQKLEPEVAKRVESHLATCDVCRKKWEDMSKQTIISHYPVPQASEHKLLALSR